VQGRTVEGEITCVGPAQGPELAFSPFDREAHQLSIGEARLLDAFAELRAEAAQGAAVLGHDLALGGELPHEGLQPALGGPVMSVDEREGRLDLLCVGLDDRRDDVVLGLEVVVDVPGGDVRGLCNVRKRGPLRATAVQKLHGGSHQPVSFPRSPRDGGGRGFRS